MENTKFVVHIGRHKTGTSSLQNFLAENKDELKRFGFCYPEAGLRGTSHRDLVFYHNDRARTREGHKDKTFFNQAYESFQDEANDFDGKVIVSSEGFQNIKPHLLSTLFPKRKTAIVVYLREQVGYLISAYQQLVQAQKYTSNFSEYHSHRCINYYTFLRKWEKAYEFENLFVRIFDQNILKNGDVIDDFLDVLSISDVSQFSHTDKDFNPSIGGKLLEFKRHLNFTDMDVLQLRKLTYNMFSELARQHSKYRVRPQVDKQTVQSIVDLHKNPNDKMFKRYFNPNTSFSEPTITNDANEFTRLSKADMDEILHDLSQIDEPRANRIGEIAQTLR